MKLVLASLLLAILKQKIHQNHLDVGCAPGANCNLVLWNGARLIAPSPKRTSISTAHARRASTSAGLRRHEIFTFSRLEAFSALISVLRDTKALCWRGCPSWAWVR